jgi:hypothetical protein
MEEQMLGYANLQHYNVFTNEIFIKNVTNTFLLNFNPGLSFPVMTDGIDFVLFYRIFGHPNRTVSR